MDLFCQHLAAGGSFEAAFPAFFAFLWLRFVRKGFFFWVIFRQTGETG